MPSGLQFHYGLRCRGRPGQCYFPWYRRHDAYIQWCGGSGACHPEILTHSCIDKSDQWFPLNQKCPNLTDYLKIFYGGFNCQNEENIGCLLFYGKNLTDIEELLKDIPHQPYYDPHNCWASCAEPGESCEGCTNPKYFQCHKSGICIHPDLRCDGHPHCEFAEDEDLDMCRDTYYRKKLIKPYASFICQSLMYPIMKTIATACDGFAECDGLTDELSCSSTNSTPIIFATLAFLFLYLILKIHRLLNIQEKPEDQTIDLEKKEPEEVFQHYQSNHENLAAVEEMNSYLLHIIFSHKTDSVKEICKKFYELEEEYYKGNQAEIYHHLHTGFDPIAVAEIIEAKFPGMTQASIDKLEMCFNRRFITELQDLSKEKEGIQQTLVTFKTLLRMLSNILDFLKDSLLAFTILNAVGGSQTILDFPTNFSSVIIMISFAIIICPLVLGTLQLVFSNPFLIFTAEKIKGTGKRILVTVLCIFCTVLNQVFLINTVEKTKDLARWEAKKYQSTQKINALFQQFKRAKNHYVGHLRLELGLI